MAYRRADYRDKWRLERKAAAIRARLGLEQLEVLSPHRLCEAVPAHVLLPADVADGDVVSQVERVPWDAFSFNYPDDATLIILLNPRRPPARQTATLMEELCHHLLRHQPSAIWTDTQTGLARRDYNDSQETEAFDLGAALLLPKERIQLAIARMETAEEVAQQHHCSTALVEYRIKRLRLWNRYARYAA